MDICELKSDISAMLFAASAIRGGSMVSAGEGGSCIHHMDAVKFCLHLDFVRHCPVRPLHQLAVLAARTIRSHTVGARTLHSLKKFQIDRLGRKFEIKREKRTWHGVVCT
jgi:hypothetical protein